MICRTEGMNVSDEGIEKLYLVRTQATLQLLGGC